MYAAKFNLLEYVTFRPRVIRVEPMGDYAQAGSWLIYSINLEENDEQDEKCDRFDPMILATGHSEGDVTVEISSFIQLLNGRKTDKNK